MFKEWNDTDGEVGTFYDVMPDLEESSVKEHEDILCCWKEDMPEDNNSIVPPSEGTKITNSTPERNK